MHQLDVLNPPQPQQTTPPLIILSYASTPNVAAHFAATYAFPHDMGCALSSLFRSTNSLGRPFARDRSQPKVSVSTAIERQHNLRFPTDVRLRSAQTETPRSVHVATLSYDSACDVNYISNGLVTDFLREEIHPLVANKDVKQAHSLSHDGIKGYVDLEWCLESRMQDWHNARFLVTTSANAPYDVVLGKRDAKRHGMNKFFGTRRQAS